MKRSNSLLLLLLVALVGCALNPTPSPVPTPGQRSGTLRVEVPASVYIPDLPWLIACDALREMGYTLETMDLQVTDLHVAALDKGDMDLSWLNTQAAYTAVSKGAKIVEILDRSSNLNLIVTKTSIATCADLQGKSIAVPGVTSPSALMMNAYVERTCPGTVPELLVVSGKRNRNAALLTGAVDGVIEEVDGLIQLQRERPGEFHAICYYAREFPEVMIYTAVVRRAFAEQNPQAVRDIIQTTMVARRSLRDQEALEEAIVRYLEYTPEQAKESAKVYLEFGTWDYEGAYDLAKVQATLRFMQRAGAVPDSLEASDVADLSYYQAALAELDGR